MAADLLGGLITVPDPTIDGVFPFFANYPSIRAIDYNIIINRVSLKKEQRLIRANMGNSWKLSFKNLYTSMTPDDLNTLTTIWNFYDAHRNPRTLFYFYDPRESSEAIDDTGTSTTGRYACRFMETQLSFDGVRDRMQSGNFGIVAVDTSKTEVTRLQFYPTRTLRVPSAEWLAQASSPSLVDNNSIIHFCSINQVYSTFSAASYPLRFATHRYRHVSTFGLTPTDTAGLYLPRLLSWDFQQDMNQSDSANVVIDDSDLCLSQYLEQIDITGWEMKFIIHLFGADGDHGQPCQFWRGYVADWQRNSNDATIQINFDGAASRLKQLIPHRVATLTCPLEFDDLKNIPANSAALAECPYAGIGAGGDPLTCDKSLDGANGCVAHGLKNYFQGFIIKPTVATGLLPRAHWFSLGRDSYNETSTALKTVYGKPIPYIYGVGKQIIEAEIFEFRDESEFKVASGILGEGPLGFANQQTYPNAIGQVLLDNLPQHTGFQPVKAYGFRGQDVGTIIDPTFRCSRLAFVSIRTVDQAGFEGTPNNPAATNHRILVEINYGMCGVRSYWWTGDLTLTRECYGGPANYCYDIFLRALGLRGNEITLVGGNDDQPRDQLIDIDNFLDVETWSASQVDSLTEAGAQETLWDFRGMLRDQKPAIDWMRDLMACSPIDVVFSFGKLDFKARKDDITTPKPTMMSFEQNENIIDKSFSAARFKPAFNSITYTYTDPAFDSAQQSVTLEDKLAQKRMGIYKVSAGYNQFVPNVMNQTVALAGVFPRSQIIRLATQVLREELGGETEAEQEAARTISFSTPMMGMGVNLNDVFKVTHEELPDGVGYFRCTGFKYNSDFLITIEGKTVRPSMYNSTPIMLASIGTGDTVKGIPGGSQGSDGSENEMQAMFAPILTLRSVNYRTATVEVNLPPEYTNYLIVEEAYPTTEE